MKKKIIALCLVVVLAVTAVTGATLAYFTDDEQATNTMTIGNVAINIDEFQKNEEGNWEEFKDNDFTLYPVSTGVGTGYRNKIAYTANVSPSEDDAYIRTIVLIEKNDLLTSEYKDEATCCFPGIHYNYFGEPEAESVINGKIIHGVKEIKMKDTVTVNGNDYWVVVFEAVNGDKIPYDHALFSLNGVFMDKNITQDQIAGWGNDGVDIIVFSQGIQATGLTHAEAMAALGEVNQTNLTKWIGADDAVMNDWAPIL